MRPAPPFEGGRCRPRLHRTGEEDGPGKAPGQGLQLKSAQLRIADKADPAAGGARAGLGATPERPRRSSSLVQRQSWAAQTICPRKWPSP